MKDQCLPHEVLNWGMSIDFRPRWSPVPNKTKLHPWDDGSQCPSPTRRPKPASPVVSLQKPRTGRCDSSKTCSQGGAQVGLTQLRFCTVSNGSSELAKSTSRGPLASILFCHRKVGCPNSGGPSHPGKGPTRVSTSTSGRSEHSVNWVSSGVDPTHIGPQATPSSASGQGVRLVGLRNTTSLCC